MASASLISSHSSMNGNVMMSDNNLLSIEEVEERIQQLLMENADLRNTLQQNNTYLKQLSITLVEWQEEVKHVQSEYCDKFEKAKQLVHQLKQENVELKRHLNFPNSHAATGSAPIPTSVTQIGFESTSPISMESFVLVASEMQNKLNQESDQLPTYDSLFQPKTKVEAADPLVCQLQREADALRAQLAVEMESNKTKQKLLNDTQSQLDQLMTDYRELCKKWDEKNQAQDRNAGVNVELEKLKMSNLALSKRCEESEQQMDSLKTRLIKTEELALAKQFQNSELQNRIAHLENELETLPILRTQVELYQTDFEAERAARQNLAGEKDALAQQVRLLKRQLEASQSSRPSSSASGPASRPASRPASASTSASVLACEQPVTQLECPKCRFAFTTMESLNNHLDICLSQHMFP